MLEEQIYGQWFYDMLDDQNLTLDGFGELSGIDQANMWYNYIPEEQLEIGFFSEEEWRLNELYGDIIYKDWKFNKK